MILVVLVQGGPQGGIGAAFGGGNSQSFFGASGATTLLGKLTYLAAVIFIFTSIMLTRQRIGERDKKFEEGLKSKLMESRNQSLKEESKQTGTLSKPAK